MPLPAPKSWILGDNFTRTYPHLASLEALWETKWKLPCKLSVYPFHHGRYSDFEPIFTKLIAAGVNTAYVDEYTEAFQPTARKLVAEATAAEKAGEKDNAIDLYERAACVLRISRFPSKDASDLKVRAFQRQKEVYLVGAALWEEPMREVLIPHTAGIAIDEGDKVPLFVRLPKGIKEGGKEKSPVVLLIAGLDGHRPDNSGRSHEFHKRGWATVICEPPGTGDSPAARCDPDSPDRLFTSILDWIASQPHFDNNKIIVWGLSAGGYYAIRVAHTHQDRLLGAIGQGAGTHHFLSRPWLEQIDKHEYPFVLSTAYVKKYGYKDWEELMDNAQKDFSLVNSGILQGKSCRLLLVNGTQDGLMPIEDSMLCMLYGRPKEGRFYDGMLHMGYPPANESVWPWMEEVMASK
ncbi:hypothetical protein DV736_g6275, partial [Chaetothyriales sp. CBS 134916]